MSKFHTYPPEHGINNARHIPYCKGPTRLLVCLHPCLPVCCSVPCLFVNILPCLFVSILPCLLVCLDQAYLSVFLQAFSSYSKPLSNDQRHIRPLLWADIGTSPAERNCSALPVYTPAVTDTIRIIKQPTRMQIPSQTSQADRNTSRESTLDPSRTTKHSQTVEIDRHKQDKQAH